MTKVERTNYFVLAMFGFQIFLSFIWGNVMEFFHISDTLNMVFSQAAIFGIPLIIYFIVTKEKLADTLSLHPLSFINIVLIILMSLFIQPAMSVLSAITSIFFPNTASALFSQIRDTPLPILVAVIGVTPAIFEEAFFRGVVLSGYRKVGIVKSCILVGILFGLMHFDLQQLLYATAMGMAFAYLVYKTGSIFSSVLAHFTINSTQAVLSYSAFSALSNTEILEMTQMPGWKEMLFSIIAAFLLFCMTAPILILLVWFFIRYNNQKKAPPEKFSNEPFFPAVGAEENCFNIPIVIICLVYLVFVVLLPLFFTMLIYLQGRMSYPF